MYRGEAAFISNKFSSMTSDPTRADQCLPVNIVSLVHVGQVQDTPVYETQTEPLLCSQGRAFCSYLEPDESISRLYALFL